MLVRRMAKIELEEFFGLHDNAPPLQSFSLGLKIPRRCIINDLTINFN